MDMYTPPQHEQKANKSTEDALVDLCRVQMSMISSLRDQLSEATRQILTIACLDSEAGNARKGVLESCLESVKTLREQAMQVVKQRDAVVKMLRDLHAVARDVTEEEGWSNRKSRFNTVIAHAGEVLKLIDQAEKASAEARARGQDGDSSGVTPGTAGSMPTS